MKKLYRNATLIDAKAPQDLLVEEGKFTAIAPHIEADAAETIDLGGRLVVPPYVDPHLHLDYVYTARGEGATNGTGTLFEGIQRWSETKAGASSEEIKRRARQAVREEVRAGVQYIRTHADVTDPNLTALKELLELREELKDIVTIQIVSFPQEGMYAYPHGAELVEEGLRLGADCVGGIPHYELAREFGEKSVHKAVELAVKYDKLIDLHCDTLTDCMYAGSNIIDTLDDPARTLSLTSIPKDIHWAQFFAVFVPDELRGEKAIRFFDDACANFDRQMRKFADRVSPCRNVADMERAWAAGKTAAFLSVENGSAFAGDLSRIGKTKRRASAL